MIPIIFPCPRHWFPLFCFLCLWIYLFSRTVSGTLLHCSISEFHSILRLKNIPSIFWLFWIILLLIQCKCLFLFCFQSWPYTFKWNYWILWQYCVSCFEESPNFSIALYCVTTPSKMCKCSSSFTSLLIL